jgi:hypothetical protein
MSFRTEYERCYLGEGGVAYIVHRRWHFMTSLVSTGCRVAGNLCLFFILILYSFLSLGHIISWLLPGETEIHYPVSPCDVCRGNGMSFSMYFITIFVPFTVGWSRPAWSACYHSCVSWLWCLALLLLTWENGLEAGCSNKLFSLIPPDNCQATWFLRFPVISYLCSLRHHWIYWQ